MGQVGRIDNIQVAISKGYYVDIEGNLFRNNKRLNPALNNSGYYGFQVSVNDKQVVVRVHRLQAYQKFGDEMCIPGVLVRHVNGNPSDNSWDNIDLGTPTDNWYDMSKEMRNRIRDSKVKYPNRLKEEKEILGLKYSNMESLCVEDLDRYLISLC